MGEKQAELPQVAQVSFPIQAQDGDGHWKGLSTKLILDPQPTEDGMGLVV